MIIVATMTWRTVLIGCFTSEHDVFDLSVMYIPIVAIKLLGDGMHGYGQGIIKALGQQNLGSIIALFSAFCVEFPVAYVLAFWFDLGIAGLLSGDGAGNSTQAVLFFIVILNVNWNSVTQAVVERIKLIDSTKSNQVDIENKAEVDVENKAKVDVENK